jgi:hypothetical protein
VLGQPNGTSYDFDPASYDFDPRRHFCLRVFCVVQTRCLCFYRRPSQVKSRLMFWSTWVVMVVMVVVVVVVR